MNGISTPSTNVSAAAMQPVGRRGGEGKAPIARRAAVRGSPPQVPRTRGSSSGRPASRARRRARACRRSRGPRSAARTSTHARRAESGSCVERTAGARASPPTEGRSRDRRLVEPGSDFTTTTRAGAALVASRPCTPTTNGEAWKPQRTPSPSPLTTTHTRADRPKPRPSRCRSSQRAARHHRRLGRRRRADGALLAWLVAPLLADRFDRRRHRADGEGTDHPLTVGLVWQFVLVDGRSSDVSSGRSAGRRCARRSGSASPRSPRSGRVGGRIWLDPDCR